MPHNPSSAYPSDCATLRSCASPVRAGVGPCLRAGTAVTARTLTIGGGTYPLVLPSIRDPRLHVAAVIITIHVLGQLGLTSGSACRRSWRRS